MLTDLCNLLDICQVSEFREERKTIVQQIATLNFTDLDSQDEATIIIRAEQDLVAIAFSLKQDGDMELVLHPKEWRTVLAHFERALALAEQRGDS